MDRKCTSWRGHRWEKRYLNSGLYHHGAIGRAGEQCQRCAAIRFPFETDAEFVAKLPAWLKEEIQDQLHSPRVEAAIAAE